MTETIGFDLDGVIYPWQELIYQHLKVYHNLELSYTEFWTGEDILSEQLWYNLVRIEHIYGMSVPQQKDLDTLHKLAEGFNFIYVTARTDDVRFATKNYLKKYKYPYHENLYMTNGEKKGSVVRAKECLYFIEDRVDFVEELNNLTNVILMKQPWNERIQDDYYCIDTLEDLRVLL